MGLHGPGIKTYKLRLELTSPLCVVGQNCVSEQYAQVCTETEALEFPGQYQLWGVILMLYFCPQVNPVKLAVVMLVLRLTDLFPASA